MGILSVEEVESSADDEKRAWSKKQNQLKGLLSFILGTASRSLIEQIPNKNLTVTK
jgi:hypothetical protein